MAELTDWADGDGISPKKFWKRSLGFGTTAQRTAITRWAEGGFFLDTDEKAFYQNTGTEFAVVWTQSVQDDSTYSGSVLALT